MTDRQAKSALTIMILLGALLGGVWAWCRYQNLLDVRSWNLMGLGVIFTVAGFAGVYALLAVKRRRAEH
jgi:hypothetical protein